ncbi:hypothetical protein [Ornithinibacillus contaminans]|uniref:hypothetical protein n=1 Tax=Ornithinibacillus contaminans TaxID=694055 RepID=UPI00064DEBD0|nr:hypothetical protein [Ornithinibacillus contaminans]
MAIFSVIAFSALAITLLALVFAIKGKHQLYWLAALGNYIFSFLAGFSIGQFTVGLTFVFLALATGYSFHLIKKRTHLEIFVTIGVLIGVLMILYVDDAWLFFPFILFFR